VKSFAKALMRRLKRALSPWRRDGHGAPLAVRVQRHPASEIPVGTGDWSILEELGLSVSGKRVQPSSETAMPYGVKILDWSMLEEVLDRIAPYSRTAAAPVRVTRRPAGVVDWSLARPHDPDLAAKWDQVVGGT
jgi:hypothetical protein